MEEGGRERSQFANSPDLTHLLRGVDRFYPGERPQGCRSGKEERELLLSIHHMSSTWPDTHL